jgi:hypothetical protein
VRGHSLLMEVVPRRRFLYPSAGKSIVRKLRTPYVNLLQKDRKRTFCPRYLSSGSLKHMPFNCCLILVAFVGFTTQFLMGTFRSANFSRKALSLGSNIRRACPLRSNLAVRPTRWI